MVSKIIQLLHIFRHERSGISLKRIQLLQAVTEINAGMVFSRSKLVRELLSNLICLRHCSELRSGNSVRQLDLKSNDVSKTICSVWGMDVNPNPLKFNSLQLSSSFIRAFST